MKIVVFGDGRKSLWKWTEKIISFDVHDIGINKENSQILRQFYMLMMTWNFKFLGKDLGTDMLNLIETTIVLWESQSGLACL